MLKGFPNLRIKVDCCLFLTASVPHASFNAIMWAFLDTKSFAAGSSMYPSSGFLRFMLMTTRQSRVSLKRHLKVLSMGLLKRDK
jgi:hypothetical protein